MTNVDVPDPRAVPAIRTRIVQRRRSAGSRQTPIGKAGSFSRENRFHLVDFRRLRPDDLTAQFEDLGIGQRGLLAHQDGTRMMRNHRAQKGGIVDRRLGPDESEAPEEGDRRSEGLCCKNREA
jgi:hypothetical protein